MPISYERAARSARRHNQRQAQRNPLFAAMDCLEEVAYLKTPEDVQRTISAWEYKDALHTVCAWIRAGAYQRKAQEVFGVDTCRTLWQHFCTVYPAHWQTCPYHVANFWHGKLRDNLNC